MKGILDRFTDNKLAVILIEEINKELIVPISELPEGSKVNTLFTIQEKNGEFEILSIDQQATQNEAQKSADLMKKLRARGRTSKFKR